MSGLARALLNAYPAAFAATYVLLAFTATPNPVSALWRPLLVAVVLALAIQLVLHLVLRRSDRAALGASILVLAGLATWVPLLVVVGAGLWLLAIAWLARRRQQTVDWSEARLSRLAASFAWALAAVAAVSAAIPSFTFMPAGTASPPAEAQGSPANIVVLLLDGYPRGDSLREQFGIDPEPFERALSDRGFAVADASRSNYTSTWMTMASMTHGRYVHEIPGLEDPPASAAEQYRLLMRSIAEGGQLGALRQRGYEIVSVPSAYDSAAILSADRVAAPAELNSFELSLIQHSLAGRLILELAPQIAFDQHRDRVRSTLELAVQEVAGRPNRPALVFAHLLAPHAPLAFVEGTPAPTCFPACSLYVMGPEADWSGYPEHLAAVNDLVLTAIDRLRASDPAARIVVMSDHGTVRRGDHDGPNAFRTFFAANVPDGSLSFPSDVTPVDVLRLLADPASEPTEPYRAWTSEQEAPMNVVPAAGADAP